MAWSEASLHRWILELERKSEGAKVTCGQPGSDAAVLGAGLDRPVLCVDQVVEGRHFTRAAPPAAVGHKAAARALSDLAATASVPRALLLTVRADDRPGVAEDEAWLRAVITAVWQTGRELGAPLVGGDISAGDGPTSFGVTALGDFQFAGQPPGREHARVGDVVLLTGPVGGSLLERHLAIAPPLVQGRWLYAHGARTLMDVSDGLALDLSRIAARSGVSIELVAERVPIHPDAHRMARESGRSPLEHALGDGEDHELIVITDPEGARVMLDDRSGTVPALCVIGHVTSQEEVGLWIRATKDGASRRFGTEAERGSGYLHGYPPEQKR